MNPRMMISALVVLLVSTVGFCGAVDAAATPQALGGLRGLAAASGIHVMYKPEGLLPTGAPVDFGSPDSLATISTGPLTFARAGIADPGDLLANPDALLAQASAKYPQGTIPPWPFRVTAGSGAGQPTADSNPAPGLTAHVEAHSDGSLAQAAMPAAATPGVAHAASVTSLATTHTDGSSAVVHSVTKTTDFELLAGLLSIDSIVTDLTATTDSHEPKLQGGTRIVGATMKGRKVTIDSDGVHAQGKGAPDVNKLLTAAGIKIYVVDPQKVVAGSAGQLTSAGLRVDLALSSRSYPAIDALFNKLPPVPPLAPGVPGVADAIVLARTHHLVGLQLGAGAVSIDARPGFTFDAPVPSLTDDTLAPSLVSGFDALAPSSPSSLAPGVALPATPAAATAAPVKVKFPFGEGVAGLLLLALIASPILGYRLTTAMGSMLGATSAADCTEEQR